MSHSFWDELVGWLGNLIFFIGQLMQVLHVQETKSCKDISYMSLFLALTGNLMFAMYGLASNSPSMFFGINPNPYSPILVSSFTNLYYLSPSLSSSSSSSSSSSRNGSRHDDVVVPTIPEAQVRQRKDHNYGHHEKPLTLN